MRFHAPKIRPESLLNPEKIAKTPPVESDRPPCTANSLIFEQRDFHSTLQACNYTEGIIFFT